MALNKCLAVWSTLTIVPEVPSGAEILTAESALMTILTDVYKRCVSATLARSMSNSNSDRWQSQISTECSTVSNSPDFLRFWNLAKGSRLVNSVRTYPHT